jgi:hypothetical protein
MPSQYSLHQMIHKSLQANIIREDSLRALTPTITGRMCRTRIQLAQQETRL